MSAIILKSGLRVRASEDPYAVAEELVNAAGSPFPVLSIEDPGDARRKFIPVENVAFIEEDSAEDEE